jgi:hypothetical protein
MSLQGRGVEVGDGQSERLYNIYRFCMWERQESSPPPHLRGESRKVFPSQQIAAGGYRRSVRIPRAVFWGDLAPSSG